MTRIEPNGSRIAELRRERGFKQSDFAQRVGISESTLRKVETRNYPLPKERIAEIANKLQTELAEIARGTDSSPQQPSDTGTLELREVCSADLVEMMRGADHFLHQTHLNVTRPMLRHMETILRIGELFSKHWQTGESQFHAHFPEWGDFPLLHAAAEITEATQALQKLGVSVLANSHFVRGDDFTGSSLYLYLSFDKAELSSRMIKHHGWLHAEPTK